MQLAKEKNFKFDILKFAKIITKNSHVQVIIVKNHQELVKYFKKNLVNNEIVIGMGAGAISKWMTDLRFSL